MTTRRAYRATHMEQHIWSNTHRAIHMELHMELQIRSNTYRATLMMTSTLNMSSNTYNKYIRRASRATHKMTST